MHITFFNLYEFNWMKTSIIFIKYIPIVWEFTPQRKANQVIYHFWLLYLNALQCEIIILEKAIPIKALKAFKFKFHKKYTQYT